MKEGSSLKFDIDAGIATLTFNRPNIRNAFDDSTIALFLKALEKIKQDKSIVAVVLTGEGKDFCAGADIHWMKRSKQLSPSDNEQDAFKFAHCLQSFYHLNKPTIAVLQGSVFGGAIGFVAVSDIVLASPDVQFCFAEVKIGMVPAIIYPYVIDVMGARAAKRLILTAELFSAQTALQMGLIDKIIDTKHLSSEVNKLLKSLQTHAPLAMQTSKKVIHTLLEESLSAEAKLDYTTHLMAETRVSKEAQEGFSAFLEKRTAKWS